MKCKPCVWLGAAAIALLALITIFAFLPPQQGVLNYSEFVSALRAQNATVQEEGTAHDDMLRGQKYVLRVNDELVQVWEYRTERQAQKDTERIGADGSSVRLGWGSSAIYDWIAPPHFYQKGRIVVLYNGENTQLFENILGQQFSPR